MKVNLMNLREDKGRREKKYKRMTEKRERAKNDDDRKRQRSRGRRREVIRMTEDASSPSTDECSQDGEL